jgi:hypothetical protein
VLTLLKDWSGWVHRRAEAIALEDKVSEKRRVSVDFTLPAATSAATKTGEGKDLYFVPLTMLQKQPLTDFDLRDEVDATLPLLTRRRNGRLATAVLVVYAEERVRALGHRRRGLLPASVGDTLERVACAPAHEATEAWASMETSPPGETDRARQWRAALAADGAFMALALDLARNFLVVVPLVGGPGVRRILKFSYLQTGKEPLVQRPAFVNWCLDRIRRVRRGPKSEDDSLNSADDVEGISLGDWVSRFLALSPKEVRIDTESVGWAASYHLEVQAPEGLQITDADLLVVDERRLRLSNVRGPAQRAHLYLSELGQAAFGEARIFLRPRPGTIMRAAFITSAITLTLLTIFALRWDELVTDLGLVLSLLLLIPGALSAYVARPREPDVTTAVLFGARLLALAPAGWAVSAGLVLTAGRTCETTKGLTSCSSWDFTEEALWICVTGAILTTVISLAGWIRSERPPECET